MRIRAAVLEEFGQPLAVQEVDLAEPKAGEALVRLVACGVCHTDLYTASGADPSGYAPCVLGHEGAGVVELQMFSIRREQGRLAEVAPIIKHFVEEDPHRAAWRPGFALIASDLGFIDAARRRLAEHAEEAVQVAFDAKRSTSLSYLAEVAVAVDDVASARRLYDLMLDYQHMTITAGVATVCYGSASRYLGMLAVTMGDREIAAEHFEHALTMNAALGARPWLAHTQAEYACLLARRGAQDGIKQAEALTTEALATAAELGMARLQRRLQTITH